MWKKDANIRNVSFSANETICRAGEAQGPVKKKEEIRIGPVPRPQANRKGEQGRNCRIKKMKEKCATSKEALCETLSRKSRMKTEKIETRVTWTKEAAKETDPLAKRSSPVR